ncbi:hypothetical protein [Herbiconiux sp. UC225_62]|uniref:hypothetical protein n=1 Tax=Herbiconiux sp. UC225_62 TaxID=3350168 RepID=UPI0036D2888F
MSTSPRATKLTARWRATVFGVMALALALAGGASGCSAETDAAPGLERPPAISSTPEPTPSAYPQPIHISATAPTPIVDRRTVGASDPGTAEQLYAINDTITFDYPSNLVQSAWRDDEMPHAQIILQGQIPDALWALLENAPLRLEVALHQGPTLDESNAVLSAMIDAVRATGPGATAGGSYDPLTGVYEFTYSAPEPIDPAVFAALTGGAAIDLWYAGSEPTAEAL